MHLTNLDFYHNSLFKAYRSPFGASEKGCDVIISAKLSDTLKGSYIFLCTEFQGNEKINLMQCQDDNTVSISLTLPDKCGLFYYYFMINDRSTMHYYGGPSGEGRFYYFEQVQKYQITLYDKSFKTPNWFKNAVIYQIFPDRFYNSEPSSLPLRAKYHQDMGQQIQLHNSWNEPVNYLPQEGSQYYFPNDFYGGNLKGITQKLDYLSELGVNCIYLNPIFESPSNHRYDCSDYLKIDPILGTNDDFIELCSKAKKRNINIILDGVFSHTSDDSRYFNRYARYDEIGAYQSYESKYFKWYNFLSYPNNYKSWWGFQTMPETNELEPSYKEFIITNKDNSVINSWLNNGAMGWRLDVADELPDEFIAVMRSHLKQNNPDAILIGEVWEDASNKFSMDTFRNYVFGSELDGVLNYPWRKTIIDFLTNHINAYSAYSAFESLRENYPNEFYYSCINMLSNHDVPRILSVLGGASENDLNMSRDRQALFRLTKNQLEIAKKRLRLAIAFQLLMPGAPSIYYGDENCAQGLKDPFNRETFSWKDAKEHVYYEYQNLIKLRNAFSQLRTGKMILHPIDENIICIIRYDDEFDETKKSSPFFCLINSSNEPKQVNFYLSAIEQNYDDIKFKKKALKTSLKPLDYVIIEGT